MIVVGDTSPLNYLVLIGQVDVLPALFSRVVIPEAVAHELRSARASNVVRRWIGKPPAWLDIQPDPADDGTLNALDSGERSAIALALLIQAEQILIDDLDARIEAGRRNLKVTGTLGSLVEAHRRRLLTSTAHSPVFQQRRSISLRGLSLRFGNSCKSGSANVLACK